MDVDPEEELCRPRRRPNAILMSVAYVDAKEMQICAILWVLVDFADHLSKEERGNGKSRVQGGGSDVMVLRGYTGG